MLAAGYLRDEGVAAGGDQDALGAEGAAIAGQPHLVRANHLGAVLENRAPGLLDAARIEFAQAFNFGVLVGDQGLPIEALFARRPPIGAGVFNRVAEFARVDEQLFRYAAAYHAGAAEAVFLGNRRAHAEAGSQPRGAHAARAPADDKQIVVEFHHDLPGWMRVRRPPHPSPLPKGRGRRSREEPCSPSMEGVG